MRIDFRKIEVEIDFEGTKQVVDVHKELANYAKMRTTDIAFEDLCREIYYNGEVEITDEHILMLKAIINAKNCPIFAYLKRGILNALNNGNNQ